MCLWSMGRKYKAVLDRDTPQASIVHSERNFCGACSAMLWLFDPQWAEWTYPFASAIDSELPLADEMVSRFSMRAMLHQC